MPVNSWKDVARSWKWKKLLNPVTNVISLYVVCLIAFAIPVDAPVIRGNNTHYPNGSNTIKCQVTASASASLSCIFSWDISLHSIGFHVGVIHKDNLKEDSEDLFACFWHASKGIQCLRKEGKEAHYTEGKFDTSNFTATIPISLEAAKTYIFSCHPSTGENHQSHECQLGQDETDKKNENDLKDILYPLSAAFVGVFILLFIFLWYRQRRKANQLKTENERNSEVMKRLLKSGDEEKTEQKSSADVVTKENGQALENDTQSADQNEAKDLSDPPQPTLQISSPDNAADETENICLSVSSQNREAGLPNLLHPGALNRRKRVVDYKKDDLHNQVKRDFEDLQKKYEVCKSKEQAFLEWGKSHAETQYPGLGVDTAYAVPYCFLGRQDIRDDDNTSLFQRIQQQQIREESALRHVALTLRLFSFKREREKLKDQRPNAGNYPLMIMGGIMNKHILQWPEHVHKLYDDVECPDMAKESGKEFTVYFTKPENSQGEIDLLVLDRQAHVIFFVIKSCRKSKKSINQDQSGESLGQQHSKLKENQWMKFYQELKTASDTFKIMFPEEKFKQIIIHKVIAMPNISLRDAKEEFGFEPEKFKDEMVHVLTKENVIKEGLEKAESEYDLSNFEDWWRNNLITQSSADLSPDLMKTIVARYIGTLSRPLGMKLKQQRSQIRTPCDAIEFSATVYKSLCYCFEDKEKINYVLKFLTCSIDDPYKRMHIKGPPGSGKTTLAIVKARKFLSRDENSENTHTQRHVIVVDIYRGATGSSLGKHVYNSIRKADKICKRNVHILPIDANMNISIEEFALKVDEITREKKIKTENLMFILDEILPLRFWENILMALDHGIYSKSLVWLTDGLIPQKLEAHEKRFLTTTLQSITRIPPTVQKVMYQVDWCKNKEYIYKPDQHDKTAPQEEAGSIFKSKMGWSSGGPMPLCVRHSNHKIANIIDCVNCSQELADLLQYKLQLVNFTFKILPCSIVLLFSVPSSLYTDSDDGHVDLTKHSCEQYAERIRVCSFVKYLDKRFPGYIEILIKVDEEEHKKDLDQESNWNKILVCWVDKIQGLIKDVVIFLPSETSHVLDTSSELVNAHDQQNTQIFFRKIPWPGTSSPATGASSLPVQSSNTETSVCPQGLTTPVTSSAEQTSDPEKDKLREKDRKLAGMYWKTEDIGRYTEWDQTNLMFAASRCTAQLILLVP